MNIEEVKQERTKLAADISELVNSFQRRTGTVVKDVNVRQWMTDVGDVPVETKVEIRIEL